MVGTVVVESTAVVVVVHTAQADRHLGRLLTVNRMAAGTMICSQVVGNCWPRARN